jgi:hypothetical protein
MSENINEFILKDETDPTDVEGHFQSIDGEGRTPLPPLRAPLSDDDDVEGHVLDLDIERKR